MTPRLWLLPSRPDPESAAIEALLREAGERIVSSWEDEAVQRMRRDGDPLHGRTYAVEREDWPAWASESVSVVRIDHHAPGDPGYGRPPAEFLGASSIGQVIAELARLGRLGWRVIRSDSWVSHPGTLSESIRGWTVDLPGGCCEIPRDLVLAAAADHCLGAAYRGECPGVDPEALMRWRVETRAAFQGRPVEAVLADVERARVALREAPDLVLSPDYAGPSDDGYCCGWCGSWLCRCVAVRDLRGEHVPELPEAAAREGIGFVAIGLPDRHGRRKVVLQSATAAQLAAWPAWAAAQGLVDLYGGDPARGFAGGYRAAVEGGWKETP